MYSDAALLDGIADALDPPLHPYLDRPVEWIEDELGEHVWSKQKDVLESLVENKFTAVRSCHSSGKSHIASRAIAWWVATRPVDEVFIVTTAPSANQVKGILWRYIKVARRKADLPGRITDAEVPEWKVGETLIGWGRKPADLTSKEDAASRFQGIHAKYLLVVLDEADGIPAWLWTAVMTLATGRNNRILAIGNPDNPMSEFSKKCMPGSNWNQIKISAFDTPAYTGEDVPEELLELLTTAEWVEEVKKEWGEDSPLYISKVLAEFPEVSDDQLFPINWIREAVLRDLTGEATGTPGVFGLDVARQGNDESVIYRNRNGWVRVLWHKRGIGDTMKLANIAAKYLRKHKRGVPMIVDADGVGAGVFDRLAEMKLPVSAFHGGYGARNKRKFRNRRCEALWGLRELFEGGLIDIDEADTDLQNQLATIKWSLDSAGRICIETKKEMKKRGLKSPDRVDAVMMSFQTHAELADVYQDLSEFNQDDDVESLTGDLLGKELL